MAEGTACGGFVSGNELFYVPHCTIYPREVIELLKRESIVTNVEGGNVVNITLTVDGSISEDKILEALRLNDNPALGGSVLVGGALGD